MRKNIMIGLLFCVAISLLGCNGAFVQSSEEAEKNSENKETNSSEEVIVMNDVVFENRVRPQVITGILSKNMFWSSYKTESKDGLYAFYVISYKSDGKIEYPDRKEGESAMDYYARGLAYEGEAVAKSLEELGVTILEDYPYCYYNNPYTDEEDMKNHLAIGYCAIVGTLEDLYAVFENDVSANGWIYEFAQAPRPDALDYIRQHGWSEEKEDSPLIWSDWYTKEIDELFGAEEEICLSIPMFETSIE